MDLRDLISRLPSGYTPGPWTDHGRFGHGAYIGPNVCVVYGPNVNAESDANGRLITLAPDLALAVWSASIEMDRLVALLKRAHPYVRVELDQRFMTCTMGTQANQDLEREIRLIINAHNKTRAERIDR